MTNLRERPHGVTIAIPNWNHEYLLGRSVGSALRAASELHKRGISSEVLVIDDHSKDGSLTLLRQLEALYFQHGLRVYLEAHNDGPAETRNVALRLARYRYILFLDADNELLPENVHLFYKSIRETQAALVYGNVIVLSAEGRTEKLYNSESVQDRLFDANYIDTFGLVDSLQILELGGYVTSAGLEDWFLDMQLCASGRLVVFVPIAIGFYYMLPNSMVLENSPEHVRMEKRFRRIFDQLNLRKGNLMRTRHLRYHPDLGFI